MPRVVIIVKPNARKNEILEREDGTLEVRVHAPAKDGKANAAVIKLISARLGIPRSRVSIISGQASKRKTVCYN